MEITYREFWTLVHGMGLGALFLLSYAGGLAEFWGLRPIEETTAGFARRARRLMTGTWLMAAAAWGTVITGTWIVYPWYREEGGIRDQLLADPNRELWHTFGMEWKEHVAWIAPLLATAVAVMVTYYRRSPKRLEGLRPYLIGTFTAAFLIAALAGLLGALITKAGPIR